MPKQQRSKRHKAADLRPARARYWKSGKLRARKIRNIVRHSNMAWDTAAKLWDATRTRYAGGPFHAARRVRLVDYA